MSGIVSLDELLNTEDLKDYGLKAEGLVTLKRFISSLDLSELDIRYPVVVPDLFAVPVSAELDDPQLSEKYFALTSEFKEPRIILARSSDPDEQPGLFETHLSFFNPASPESSFHYWLEAAKKVRASGSRALLGQAMVGALEDFPHDINYDELSDYRKMYVTLPSFGGTNSSFVGRSHSVIRGNRPSLVACRGLGTKIARGDRDVVIITSGKNRTDALNLIHNYRSESLAISPQETVDVVSLTHPDRISTLDYHSDAQFDEMAFHARIPFAKYLFEDRENGYWGFSVRQTFLLMDALQEKAGMPVEIEACINDSGLYLLQLRGYELPRKHFAGLHQIPESKMFFKTKRESLGFDQFKGDVVMSYDLVDCDPEKIFAYFGNVSKEDLPHLEKYKCLIFPMVSVGGNYEAAHSFGYTSQILVELEKRGVRAIAVAGLEALAQFDESERFQRLNSRTRLLKDVTVECDGTDAQIYFNT